MNIIIVSRSHGQSRSFKLGNRLLWLAAVLFLVVLFGAVYGGYQYAQSPSSKPENYDVIGEKTIKHWQSTLRQQRQQVANLQRRSNEQLDALTLRLGQMQARLLRLDALGQRLTEVAKLGKGEFDFNSDPAVGGPGDLASGESYEVADLQVMLKQLEAQIDSREQQLEVMDDLFVSRRLQKELFIAGRPIKRGWMSSQYGYRSDPFTGKRAWHAGVDFAGKEGSDIVAVAAGVVTFASDRYGYGQLIEVNHGKGIVTRYAHCKELLVNVGDVVQKGQVVAKMGSTGRSTGPHVHFEVLKNNKTLNPKKYIYRASR